MKNDQIAAISEENLYRHVLELEGIRHPIVDPRALNRAADYIADELGSCCTEVHGESFTIEDFNMPFRNVSGLIRRNAGPELLITAHYDTVWNSPGADDNASAVAIMLEAARILSGSDVAGTVRCIGFTLEEGNPAREARLFETGKHLGLLDERHRWRTLRSRNILRQHEALKRSASKRGLSHTDSWADARMELGEELTSEEDRYLDVVRELHESTGGIDWIGRTSLVGSDVFAQSVQENGIEIAGVINLETIGFTSTKDHSQRIPPGLDPALFAQHKLLESATVGNYAAIAADSGSIPLGKLFFDQCVLPNIDLPAFLAAVPFEVAEIAVKMPDLLRSDHAPFWLRGYPAIMITDTADFRTPYYHSPADTIDKLDFEFMKKVCAATVATALNPSAHSSNRHW